MKHNFINMNKFSVLFFCIQAFVLKTALSQYVSSGLGLGYAPAITSDYEIGCGPALAPEAAYALGIGPAFGYGYGHTGSTPFGAPNVYAAGPAYGGTGIGDVEVAGEMPVAGTTIVAGQVPILGAVQFGGDIPAGGVVTIAGRCGCGCNGPYVS